MADCANWAGDNLTVTVRKIDAYRRRANLPPSDLWEEGSHEDPLAVGPTEMTFSKRRRRV